MRSRLGIPFEASLYTVLLLGGLGSSAAEDPPHAPAGKKTEAPADAFYTVSSYDVKRDVAVDLAATIKRAQAERKRIILEIGGVW